jgi:hypothetical protein
MGPAAVAQQLGVSVLADSKLCYSSKLLSQRTRSRHVSPTNALLPHSNSALKLNAGHRGWCPRPSSGSGISRSTVIKCIAESAASGDSSEIEEKQQAPLPVLGSEDEDNRSLLEQVKEIFLFAGPALGIWLSGPLMSVIDTAVVGSKGSSLELAALGKIHLSSSTCPLF